MSYRYDRDDQIQKYSGIPNAQDQKEISRWGKFLRAFLPWVTKKWELGNAYLEAKVAKEKNEADKIQAESVLLKIKAEKEIREIIDTATKKDEIQLTTIEKTLSNEEMEVAIKEFIDKIKMLNLKYGLRISISIQNEDIKASAFEKTGKTDDL